MYDPNTQQPVLIYMHGQFGDAATLAAEKDFQAASTKAFISIFPQGLNDKTSKDCGTGWNVIDSASSHDQTTCKSDAFAHTCCYSSCIESGACTADGEGANCGWATCADDDTFVMDIVEQLQNELCVGDIWLAGESNGGMLAHGIMSKHPGAFKNIMPVYGLPFFGHAEKITGDNSSLCQLHGRSDTVIPFDGGEAPDNGNGGWIYESAKTTLAALAKERNCEETESKPISTPFDGGVQNIACENFGACSGTGDAKTTVMFCLYDGYHGDFPADGTKLAMWFFEGKWQY